MTNASDHAAFMAAICADPADDLPRLIYADWLDEHGDPERAEFIRLQIDIAKVELFSTVDQVARHGRTPAQHQRLLGTETLRHRESELLADLWPRLAAEWRWAAIPIGKDSFRRGFVSTLDCRAEDFGRHAAGILSSTPLSTLVLSSEGNWTYTPGEPASWSFGSPPYRIAVIIGPSWVFTAGGFAIRVEDAEYTTRQNPLAEELRGYRRRPQYLPLRQDVAATYRFGRRIRV